VKELLITIDGPAGAGKTTVSRRLAEALGYAYVDTGALYRGVAYAARQQGIGPEDDKALAHLCAALRLEVHPTTAGSRLYADGVDISDSIRSPEMSMMASAVSARPVVREALLSIQRRLGAKKNAVFEGRDMGTVVFPEADIKFFLTAEIAVRARRRYRELAGAADQDLEAVTADMARRDENDAARDVAPLKPAADALIIDSGDLSVEGVVEEMIKVVAARRQ
jgi:cytidylate kinase